MAFLFPSFIESTPVQCSRPNNNAVPDFLMLANALSALYPNESEGERLLDAVLLAMPRCGEGQNE